jgi:hypothetical protein
VQLTNASLDPMGNLVVMAFDGFTPPAAYLANPDTTHPPTSGRRSSTRPPTWTGRAAAGRDEPPPSLLRFGNPTRCGSASTTLLAPTRRLTSTPTRRPRGEPYAYAAAA